MRIHAKIENQLKITDLYTAFKAERTPDYHFRGESHDFWELLIVADGAIGSVINNEVDDSTIKKLCGIIGIKEK